MPLRHQVPRQFMRHPTGVPIEVIQHNRAPSRQPALNISAGGIAFHFDRPLQPGTVVRIRIDAVNPVFEADAQIVWCRVNSIGYEMGAAFLDPLTSARADAVRQIREIERYRRAVLESECRTLTPDEAAEEFRRQMSNSGAQAQTQPHSPSP